MAAGLWLKKRNVMSKIDDAFVVMISSASMFHLTARAGAPAETMLHLLGKN
jgi:hypothetical protein